jgi:hypothetical protein
MIRTTSSNLKASGLTSGCAVAPGLREAAGVDPFHHGRAWRWANEVAEIAADAFPFDDVWVTNSVDVLPVEALMRAVVYDVHRPLAVGRNGRAGGFAGGREAT